MKWLAVIFVPLYVLVTVFGLGPVLLADGTTQERLITLLIVLVIYALLSAAFLAIFKRFRKSSRK